MLVVQDYLATKVAAQELQYARPSGLFRTRSVGGAGIVHESVAGVDVRVKFMDLAILFQFAVQFDAVFGCRVFVLVAEMALNRAMDFCAALKR